MRFDPNERHDQDVYPAGRVVLEIQDVEVKTSKKGDLYANFRASVVNGSKGGVFFMLMLNTETFWKWSQLCKAAGVTHEFTDLTDQEELADVFIGTFLAASLQITEFNERKRNEVKSFLPLTEEERLAIETGETDAINPRLSGGSGGGATGASGGFDDDDIPF